MIKSYGMNNKIRKRRDGSSESEDSQNIKKKKKTGKKKLTQEDYTKILPMISLLSDLISEFSHGYQNSNDIEIINKLNECQKKIPTIVTFGSQSSGKSALLNKLFKLKLKSCPGIGTKCPIVIQASPTYENKIIVMDHKTNTENTFDTLEKAEIFINDKTRAKENTDIQFYNKIIYKINCTWNIIIVDLPGCVHGETIYDEYFNHLKQEYLMKPETIILHVVSGVQDPETDISMNYLQTNNKIIKVLTHTDLWQHDKPKIENLYNQDRKLNCTIAITNIDKDESKVIDGFEINKTRNEIIKGSSQLLTAIAKEYEAKIYEFIPELKDCITKAKLLIDDKFEIIGRQKPDMRQIIGEFRIFMTNTIKKEFNDGSNLAFSLNELKTNFTVQQLQKYDTIIPSANELAIELSGGSLNQIAGTEGWNNLVQKWIAKLMEKSKQELVIVYVQNYCNVILNQSINVLNNGYKPCTNKAIIKIINSLRKRFNNMNRKIIDEIISKLDNIASQPYNSDTNYVRDYLIDVHVDPVNRVLEYIKTQHNLTEALKYASANTKKVLENVMNGNEFNNFYLSKAKNAHLQLINFWKSKSVYIHDLIIHELNSFRKQFQYLIEEKIQRTTKDDLFESSNINEQRQLLLNIYDKCEEILKLVNY